MSSLPTPLRRQLESAIKQARKIAEAGARHALEALAVHEPAPYQHMDEAQRTLRRQLRAQAKQLGDGESRSIPGGYEIKHLAEKLAYDQWHRLLFARYLLENDLLISPEHGVSVSLDDCEELNSSLGLKDAWAVAARFAAKELPEIFRVDDPAGAVELSVNDRKPLIEFVTGLPVEVFTAGDSLGWCYQFWQAEKKDEVNAAGNKIGADELPAVTQLFTEDYMVDFLLDNTLGAWHAGKLLAAKPALAETAQCEEELRNAVALPGCPWKYLRFIKTEDGKWSPAAGTFDGWPKTAQELKCLDPCMGSGHFVVALFERLVALRMTEERLEESEAVAAVIRDNLFGLEIDPRCTQIAAFNLALAAWRRVGHCKLPAMNLACSGLAPNTREADWLAMADDNEKLKYGMARLYRLFKDAPVLGSLINPKVSANNMFVADYHELQPLLEKALAQETQDDTAHEMAVTARGLAKAAEILAGQFTLVATNVPYLARGKQDEVLQAYCSRIHPKATADLATCFVERCIEFCNVGGSTTLVTPQNWLFLVSYKHLRLEMLKHRQWIFVARLGPKAFQTPMWDFNVMLICLSTPEPTDEYKFAGVDVANKKTVEEKATGVAMTEIVFPNQLAQLNRSNSVVTFEGMEAINLLAKNARSFAGLQTGDNPRFMRQFWEIPAMAEGWAVCQSSPERNQIWSGCASIVRWWGNEGAGDDFFTSGLGVLRGKEAWNHRAVSVGLMSKLPVSIYNGNLFSDNMAVLLPNTGVSLESLFCFCESDDFAREVRKINQKIAVKTQYLLNIPFDLVYWQKVAAAKYPDGLPNPFSSDPTQWMFNGNPTESDQPMQVTVARMLGYQWPRQTGSSFPDCPALTPDGLETLADVDGIVCLSTTKGEPPAAERLRGLLVQALGNFDLSTLLSSTGPKGSKSGTIDEWLRDEFFEQHCALFHHRPFIWHIWDGHKSGFNALVNYHKLDHVNLEKLTYSYLGNWIQRQQAAVDAGEAGSDARLQAAKNLQARLKLILEGEPPYDIFVRWKPLSQQAIGWHPDINDGVRMNIRPFIAKDIPGGKKGVGILRTKPNIKWEKDRGKEPMRDKAEFPWFWGWDEQAQDFTGVGKEPDGNRWNGCHYSNGVKQAARISKK